MASKIEAKTKDGKSFFIEIEADEAAPASASGSTRRSSGMGEGTGMGAPDRVLKKTDTMFSKAVEIIKSVSQDVSSGLLESNPRPSEVELSLDLGFDAGGDVWILRGSAKASMRLSLKWNLPAPEKDE